MYVNTIFILYLVALLISVICLVFIGLVFVQKKERKNPVYRAVRRFAVAVTLMDSLYFVFYYREVVRRDYELDLPFRLADYTLYILLFLCWILLVMSLTDGQKHRRAVVAATAFSALRLAVSLFVTWAYMGAYYNIDNPAVRNLWIGAEAMRES